MRLPNGAVPQSGLMQNPGDYGHERIYWPVVGVVLAVHTSDDPVNTTAIPVSDQRGTCTMCDVYVVSHGSDNPWIVPNVVVLPRGPSGVDDFSEDIPRACSQMIDGSTYDLSGAAIDPMKLDGDWCVVGFVGGSIEQPIMLNWYPHPGNHSDPATAGFPIVTNEGQQDAQTLQQGRRGWRRYRGFQLCITDEGSVFVDTTQSNSTFDGSMQGPQRKQRDSGGDIYVNVKKSRQLQVNFNPPIPLPDDEPSVPQPNPPSGQQQRATDRTTITLDKDTINLLAGKICEILTSDDYIDLHAKTKVRLRGDDGNNSVLLGGTDASNMDHAVKGETFRMLMNAFIQWAITHTHGTAVGDTTTPNESFTQTMTDDHLSQPVMVQK